jgi:hypothetical protein
MNRCPEKAIETAHGMAAAFWIIFTAINTQIILFIIKTLKINSEIWWWNLAANIISIGCMVLIITILYRIMHYAMGIKPVKYLIRFTSLTSLPFWRRYKFINNNKTAGASDLKENTLK